MTEPGARLLAGMVMMAWPLESAWLPLYPPPITVMVPVGVPRLPEPVMVTVTVSAVLEEMVVAESCTFIVDEAVPASETQALTTLDTLRVPRPVAML